LSIAVNAASAVVFILTFTGNGNAYSGTGSISFDDEFTGARDIISLTNYQSTFTIGTRTYTQADLFDNPVTAQVVVNGTPGNRTLQFNDEAGTIVGWTTGGFANDALNLVENSNTINNFTDVNQGIPDPGIAGTFTAVEIPFEFNSAFGLLAAGTIFGAGFWFNQARKAKTSQL
jgi:hypothetical protein